MTQELWTDGGVILRNPSPHGGTWSWVLVEDGREVSRSSGVMTLVEMSVTNNQAELHAALMALGHNPDFAGTLFTDSRITLARLTNGASFEGVPQWMRLRCLELRRCRRWAASHVTGHATKRKLRNVPSLKWNILCDEMCREEADRFLRRRGRT